MNRRIFAFLLALVMVFQLVSPAIVSADGVTGSDPTQETVVGGNTTGGDGNPSTNEDETPSSDTPAEQTLSLGANNLLGAGNGDESTENTSNPEASATVNGVTTNYARLVEAIDAAYNGGTVELLRDVTVDHWHQNIWSLSENAATYPDGRVHEPTVGPDGLTINGNNHTLTVNSIDSGSNGNQLFFGARNLTVSNMTIAAVKGIGLFSGTIENVTFNMSGAAALYVSKNADGVTIRNCKFNSTVDGYDGYAVYTEGDTSHVVISGNTFNTFRSVSLYNDTVFTNNIVNGAKGVTVARGSTATVTGNYFAVTNTARSIDIYPSNATISENVILGRIELESEKYTTAPNLSANYWGGEAPTNLPEGIVVNSYYNAWTDNLSNPDEDGSLFDLDMSNAIIATRTTTAKTTTYYISLKDAIAAAQDGDTVKLLANVDATGYTKIANHCININKSITLDGNGHTIEVDSRGIAINQNGTSTVNVTIKNVTVNNAADYGRGISTRGNIGTVVLDNVKINCTGTGGNPQGLTVGGNQAAAQTIYIQNGSEIHAGNSGYCIITFNPVNMNITDSTLDGWANIYAKGIDNSAGSAGSIFTINGSTLISKNVHSGESNAFAMFQVADEDVTINVTNSEINVSATGDQPQGIGGVPENSKLTGINVNLGANNVGTFKGNAVFGLNTVVLNVSGGVYNKPVPEEYCADGYQVVENDDPAYPWKVAKKPAATVTTTTNDSGKEVVTATIDAGFITDQTDHPVEFGVSGSDVSVTFDAVAAKKIATNAGNSALKLKVEDKTKPGATSNTKTYEITMVKVVNGVETTDPVFSDGIAAGKATVTVPFEAVNDNPVVVNLVVGTTKTPVPCTYKNNLVTFTVEHFSDYEVTQQSGSVAKLTTTGAGDRYYATLEAAFAAAVDGDTIKLLANCEGNGIIAEEGKFPNGLTVDFDGHTYTITGPSLAGSTGTKTQAFQLLKDSTITFKNGAIVGNNADVKMLIQNYSNLTLDNMDLDATKGTNNVGYVLSTNNGSTTIKDTTITAKTGGTAFDACSGWGSYQSNAVTVTGSSVITGDVEVSYYGQTGTAPATLTLTSGTLTGNIVMGKGAEETTVTKDADFSAAAPEGYKWVEDGNSDKLTAINYVAQIGETNYESLAEAFAAAQDGNTIKLLQNVNLTDRLFINAGAEPAFAGTNNRYATTSESKELTLDLNGKNITTTSNIALAGGSLNITGTGKITSTGSGLAPIEIRGTGALTSGRSLTIGKDVTLEGGDYGLNIFGSNTADKNKIDVTINGTVNGTVFVLGNLTNTENAINIVVNGNVDGANEVGIALNGNANVTVKNGATVEGTTGIEVRAGSLTVEGGTITGTGAFTEPVSNPSGTTSSGAAVAVSQHQTKLPISVTLTGGTLQATGTDGKLIVVGDPENNGTIAGSGTDKVQVVATESFKNNSAVAEGYKWVDDGNGNYTLEAIVYHTVSFVNGNTTTTAQVAEGEKVTKPTDPIQMGYTFLGWYAEGASKAFNFDTAINANLTLTAQWKENQSGEYKPDETRSQNGYMNYVSKVYLNLQDQFYYTVQFYINEADTGENGLGDNWFIRYTYEGETPKDYESSKFAVDFDETEMKVALAKGGTYTCCVNGSPGFYEIRHSVYPKDMGKTVKVELYSGNTKQTLWAIDWNSQDKTTYEYTFRTMNKNGDYTGTTYSYLEELAQKDEWKDIAQNLYAFGKACESKWKN